MFLQRDERVLIAWSDDLDHIVPLCAEFEEKLMKLVWRSRTIPSSVMTSTTTSVAPSTTASNVNLNEKSAHQTITVTDAVAAVALAEKEGPKTKDEPTTKSKWSWRLKKRPTKPASTDLEKGSSGRASRPIRLFAPVYGGLGLGLSICEFQPFNSHTLYLILRAVFIASGLVILLQEWRLDHDYKRFALLVTTPFLLCISLVSVLILLSILGVSSVSPSIVLCPPAHWKPVFCVRGCKSRSNNTSNDHLTQPRPCCSISRKFSLLLRD